MITDIQKAKLDSIGWCSLTNRESLYDTFEIAMGVLNRGVTGCFVECGVFAGAQTAAMWYASDQSWSPRPIHLFDSFEGIPVAGAKDGDDIANLTGRGDKLVSSGKSVCSVDEVKKYMGMAGVPIEWCVYHKGWFQDTLPQIDTGPIALLRLDGDLYDSTYVCLKHAYPLVSVGGIVIIDDWPLVGCRQAVMDYLVENNLSPMMVIQDFGPAWWMKTQ